MLAFKVAPYGFFKSEKCKFQPQKLPIDISKKNETKVISAKIMAENLH